MTAIKGPPPPCFTHHAPSNPCDDGKKKFEQCCAGRGKGGLEIEDRGRTVDTGRYEISADRRNGEVSVKDKRTGEVRRYDAADLRSGETTSLKLADGTRVEIKGKKGDSFEVDVYKGRDHAEINSGPRMHADRDRHHHGDRQVVHVVHHFPAHHWRFA